jgi:D-3-phosphoglycerate dehydrogenase / 2-oxoglutarate reductase
MDVLIVEPLDADVLQWLQSRHSVRWAPQLAHDPRAFRLSLRAVRAMVLPPSVAVDAQTLAAAPLLCAVGRLSVGAENIDVEACALAGVEVVRPSTASAAAEAEFLIGALLQMLRRVPILSADGLMVGRELGGSVVGIVGMAPAAKPLAELLRAFGANVVGYDPALHVSDPVWARWGVLPMGLRELMRTSDGVGVLLSTFTRYRGLFGERFLAECKTHQVLVSLAHSSLFDEFALAEALDSGRMAAAWFDSMEPGMLDPGRPLALAGGVQVTPRVASTTLQSRLRSAWAVARRIDELLAPPGRVVEDPAAIPTADVADFADLEGGSAPA